MNSQIFLAQTRRLTGFATFGLFVIGLTSSPIRASMILTPAGVAQGLTLSTFASGFPSSGGVGPLGVAFVPGGGVLVSDDPGNVRLFPSDADGQSAGAAPIAQNYGGGNAVDLAQVGGNIYMTRQGIGDLVQINNNGTFNQVIVAGMPAATGMVADTFTGHLFVSTLGNNIIWNVDPIAKTKTVFVNASADGLTISGDGSTVYGEVNGHILGWNATTGVQVFDSGLIPGSPDGAAIGAGLFAGQLFVNTNSGQLFEINQTTLAQTLIGTGGSRGDFVTVDTTNNTLLLTQTDSILRLTGASFTTTTPEPASLALIGFGLAGIAILRRRHSASR